MSSDSDWESISKSEEAFAEYLLRRYGREGEVDIDAFREECPSLAVALDSLAGSGSLREGSLAERLRRRYGDEVDPEISLDSFHSDHAAGPSSKILKKIAEREPGGGARYKLRSEIARGGMGAILKVWDQDLRRTLAMKVVLGSGGATPGEEGDGRILTRFLEEAQITGQLDHPGIVPVHELGIDSEGRIYFTMRLVKGEDFKDVIDQVHAGEATDAAESWTRTRALGVLLKSCEAMAFAHSKGVIHRDLKPANIMVGRFGETYVMDWGLARVLGRDDELDIRVRDPEAPLSSIISTEARERAETDPDAPLITMDGDVVGTPAYMPPEQASGNLAAMGPHSDVYSLGAILYHLLSGQVPYVGRGARVNNYAIWARVQEGPPTAVDELDPDLPTELVTICKKAMARDAGDRYRSVMELAGDLRAFLEGRPISARPPTLRYVFRLAVRRNRPVAITAAASLFVLVVATLGFIFSLRRSLRAEEESSDAYARLAAVHSAPALIDQERRLLPAVPDQMPAMERWLEQVDDLLFRQADYHAELDGTIEGDLEREEAVQLLAGLGRLEELRPAVVQRLDDARTLPARTIGDPAWTEAIASIRQLEAYRQDGEPLMIEPQLGLLPLRWNERSGLWEFWVVGTGERPVLGDTPSGYEISDDMAIVFVLLPGEPSYMLAPDGIQDPSWAGAAVVDLDPFFVSKFEVTQGQWRSVMRGNPSGRSVATIGVSLDRHPVEYVSWDDAQLFCRLTGVTLPSEAQWDYACRAGTRTRFWFGDDPMLLHYNENVLDLSFPEATTQKRGQWDDGFGYHAPVGSFAANAFGLFDLGGNVIEWCADFRDYVRYPVYETELLEPGTGLMRLEAAPWRSARGGSYYIPPEQARSDARQAYPADARQFHIGFRVARRLR